MESSPPTYEEWFEYPHIQMLAASDHLGWGDIHVSAAVLNPGKAFTPSPAVEDYTLIAGLQGTTRMRVRIHSYPQIEIQARPGDLEIIPPFIEADSQWDAPITAAFVRISSSLLKKLAEENFRGDPEHVQVQANLQFNDPLLRELTSALCNEMYQANPFGPLYVDSLTRTLMLHLLKQYSNAVRVATATAARGKLTSAQVRLLADYIEAHLEQKISLGDLARCVHASVPHFERLFRLSFGCAPYQYVLKRRIERAKLLLGNSSATLYEVARQSGFANQSHLTKHFTRAVGVSPARYRAQSKR